MHTERTLKNSIISVTCQIVTLLLQFLNRKIFIIFLDIEYLGYQSLFSNVFSILSIAELGVGNIIAFHLYKEITAANEEEIGKLMQLYKWIYRIIAAVVCLAGLICFFFLPYMVKNPSREWSYLYLIYFLQLGSVVIGYFLSYRRTIYIANQREYYCVQTDLAVQILIQILQIATLAIFRNYILYLAIQLSSTFIANLIIARKSKKDYPYLQKKYKITKQDIKKRNIIKDMKNFLMHKIAYAVYTGTDSIVISAFCGIRQVALYGSYYELKRGVMQVFFYKLLNPVQATIGNIMYSEKTMKQKWDQFKMLDVFSFFFADYIGLGFLVFLQPVIQLWLGADYLLSFSFVIAFSLTAYLGAVFEIVYKYRSVFGDYAQDRNCMIVSALMNIAVSVVLSQFIGVTGVQIGTLIAFLPMAYGRIRFVVKHYFQQSMSSYILKHLLMLILTVAQGALIYLLVGSLPVSFAGILLRVLAWVLIPLVINTAIFHRNKYFKEMLVYLKRMLKIMTDKIKHKKGETSNE